MHKTIVTVLIASAALPALAQAPALRRPLRGGGQGGGAAQTPSANAVASASAVDAEADKDKASDLNFLEAPLDMVLETYGKLVNRTVLKDPSVPSATITLQSRPGQKLTREEQIEAIEVCLEMNGVHMDDYGEKFVRALPRDKVRQEGIFIGDEDAELEESGKVASVPITFKNIPIDEAKTVLEGLKSQKGQLLVYERIGKILVTDTMQNINRMKQIARTIDVATPINENVFVRQIKHANATEIKTALEQIVQESQKELEKAGKAAKNAEQERPSRLGVTTPGTAGISPLRRPGMRKEETPATANVESLVTSVSDADRGMIRGKVLITADERSNKLIVITAKTNMDFFDKIIEQLDVETTPDTVVKVYRLKYAEAEDVSDMINDLIGNTQKSSGSSRDNQNAAAKSGTGGNLTRGSQSGGSRQSSSASSANNRSGEAKAGELTKENTQVLADKRINGLVVMTQKELVPTIESIIDSMDIKLSQVLIETVIIEVNLGDGLTTGIDWVQRGRNKVTERVPVYNKYGQQLYWEQDPDDTTKMVTSTTESDWPVMKSVTTLQRDGLFNNGNYILGGGGGSGSSLLQSLLIGGASNATELAAGATSGGLNYFLKSDKLNIAAIIQASKNDNQAKYLASPVIMTVDNKEAKIDATSSRQFLTGWTAQSSSYAGSGMPSPQYTAKDIGVKLTITPKINPNGTVMLKVNEEYNQATETQMMKTPVGNTYRDDRVDVPSTRTMEADVLLENMQTVVFGGLIENTKSHIETGIPILKDIPIIGKWLFGSVEDAEQRRELLVFLTPYVLNDGEAAQAEALRRKKALSVSAPWDDHEWSASDLADPIPTKELLRKLKEEAKRQDEDRQNRLAIEKWKMDRAKELEKMTDSERRFWIEEHKDELEKERKAEFESKVEELSQEDLRKLADEIREQRLKKAAETTASEREREKDRSGELEPASDAGKTDASAEAESHVNDINAAPAEMKQ